MRARFSVRAVIFGLAFGFMATALILLTKPFGLHWMAYVVMAVTFLLLNFTKIKAPVIIVLGVALGLIF